MSVNQKPMTLNEYQKNALAVTTHDWDHHGSLEYATAGLAGEAGELMNVVKKIWRRNGNVGCFASAEDRRKIEDELGDVLWYAQAIAYEIGVDLETVARGNIEKLIARKAEREIAAEQVGFE